MMMAHHPGGQQANGDMQQCIDHCTKCHRICAETLSHCLQLGGKHAELSHIRLLLDCAQICRTSADFMIRGSDLHPRVCALCADLCERCAQDCERVDRNDAQMEACVDLCRRCAETCRRMASAQAA